MPAKKVSAKKAVKKTAKKASKKVTKKVTKKVVTKKTSKRVKAPAVAADKDVVVAPVVSSSGVVTMNPVEDNQSK